MSSEITETIEVDKDISTVYRLWADFENFPHFMSHIKSVKNIGDGNTRWVMGNPLGKDFQWEARALEMEKDSHIKWESTKGDVTNDGEVNFEKIDDDKTRITVTIKFDIPMGIISGAISELTDYPRKSLRNDLQAFRKYANNSE
jgi:uncharacterized membrane protein